MNLVKLMVLVATGLFLSACRVQLIDGKIPAKYISLAQEKSGHYSGTFEGKASELNLIVNNDGSAVLNIDNGQGDILGADCKSVIGELNGIWASSKKVGGASFKFQTQCNVLGKTVNLDFNKNEKLLVTIIKDSYETTGQSCTGGGVDSEGYPVDYCTTTTYTNYTYFSGKFKKN